MAKIQIKSEKLTPFGGFFSIMEQFDALLAQTIDSTLGLRCTLFGYQYSEILRSLMCVYLCGLKSGQEYDFDFDHQFIKTEKYDAKPTTSFWAIVQVYQPCSSSGPSGTT